MPRTLAQNAQYIAETIKPAIKSAIEAQGVTVPSTDSFLDYADRIGEIEGGGSGYQLKDLPTGAISTVNDAAELPLNALKVSVEAWQEGTGDPSPSNVRPIHGWDSGEITVCDDIQNPTQTETITQQFPQTIYGAEWDVVNGTSGSKNTFGEITLNGDETYTINISDTDNISFRYRDSSIIANPDGYQISNMLIYHRYAWGEITAPPFSFVVGINELFLKVPKAIASTVEELKIWISSNNIQFVYELATPTTIDLSPLSIRMLQGTNNLYADCGEVIEGEYFVDEGAHRYQLYDYIESDGTQCIDLGVELNANDVVECIYVPLSGMTNWNWLWIAEDTNTSKFSGVVFMSSSQMADYDYSVESNRRSWTTNQISESSLTASAAINANVKFSDGAIVKLYSLSINNNYFLPCKRKSDGVFGLYDVTNQTFLTDSAGGNAFVGGNPTGVEV